MGSNAREEGLKRSLAAKQAYLPIALHQILYRRRKVRLSAILKGLASAARVAAIYAYFVEGSSRALKQNYYLAAKLQLASLEQDDGNGLTNASIIFSAMLSDNAELIETVARLETPQFVHDCSNPRNVEFHIRMLQLALLDEHAELKAMIERLAHSGPKRKRLESAEEQDFYSLFLKRDKEALERLIEDHHAKIKSADPIDEDFFSYLGVREAKLCWLKGIPVQINSPLVPMELMPVQPLDHYDDVYEFLKPGWIPPRQGIFADFGRWVKRVVVRRL